MDALMSGWSLLVSIAFLGFIISRFKERKTYSFYTDKGLFIEDCDPSFPQLIPAKGSTGKDFDRLDVEIAEEKRIISRLEKEYYREMAEIKMVFQESAEESIRKNREKVCGQSCRQKKLTNHFFLNKSNSLKLLGEVPADFSLYNSEKIFKKMHNFELKKFLGFLEKSKKIDWDRMLRELLDSSDWRLRNFAIKRVFASEGEKYFEPLKKALQKNDRAVLERLNQLVEKEKNSPVPFIGIHDKIRALKKFPIETQKKKLLEFLQNPDPLKRIAVLKAIKEIPSQEFFFELTRILEGYEDLCVKKAAVFALEGYGRQGERLIWSLLEKEKGEQLLCSINVLAKIGGKDSLPKLYKFLRSSDKILRFYSERAIAEINKRNSIG